MAGVYRGGRKGQATALEMDAIPLQVAEEAGASTLRAFRSCLFKIHEHRSKHAKNPRDVVGIAPIDRMVVLLDKRTPLPAFRWTVVAVAGDIFRVEGVSDNSKARTHEIIAEFLSRSLTDKVTHVCSDSNAHVFPKMEIQVPFYGIIE